jgi:hypothetical protein
MALHPSIISKDTAPAGPTNWTYEMVLGTQLFLICKAFLSGFLGWEKIFLELPNKEQPFRICCSLTADILPPPSIPTVLARDDSKGQLCYLQHGIGVPVATRDPKLLDLCRVQHNCLLSGNNEFNHMVESFCKVNLCDSFHAHPLLFSSLQFNISVLYCCRNLTRLIQ